MKEYLKNIKKFRYNNNNNDYNNNKDNNVQQKESKIKMYDVNLNLLIVAKIYAFKNNFAKFNYS